MKFTGPLSTLLVVLPFLVLQGSAAPFNFGGNNGKGIFGKDRNGHNKNGANSQNGAAGAANSTAAGASNAAGAANSTAAAGASNAAGAANSTAAAGASNAAGAANSTAAAGGDPQTSLTLDPSVIGANIAQDGTKAAGAVAGQTPSLTSTNNFINSCVGKTITDGQQIQAGSCNPIPMGDLPAKANQPSAKFLNPKNLDNLQANTAFTIQMNINNLQTGFFVNPDSNYFAAPQALNAQGIIQGHSHAVIQAIPSITSTTPTDPTIFDFFQGMNQPASNGVLTATVAKGLPEGTYRLASLNTASNHQPAVGPVAQKGPYDDMVYFTVGAAAAAAAQTALGGAAASNGTAAAAAATPPAAAPPAASNATAAAPPASGAAGAGAAASGAAGVAAGTPPAASNATAASGANAGAAKGAAKAKGKGGRRSFIITRPN